ncbi:MAG: signal recognition particle-docking protein FtsY [Pelagibacterales bacterium]|jgi:fused signal recognition particle receptor|nr:signal recognition particle-docking protein FtsY [Pelagibacterales bacterium]
MSIFDKFKLGLSKSSKNLSSGLNDLIFKKKIDENMLNELEDFLIQSDVGVESAKELREKFANTKVNPKTVEKDEIFKIFSNYVYEILKPLEKNLENINKNKPSVILIAGVNGVGKTTTIGKLGKILGQNNKKIVLGAADTFRAAAVSQLEVWAKRINADIIKSDEGADPASVAYKALDHAKKNNFDYLLIDTAGRLQNKKNLMDEFKKITKVLKKIDSNAPHETFLILDATTGQSAISQVEEFKKISPITGIIMTKLDGTAKGGILLAIGKKFKLPIIALCMGEKEDDLQTFNSEYFSNALMQF